MALAKDASSAYSAMDKVSSGNGVIVLALEVALSCLRIVVGLPGHPIFLYKCCFLNNFARINPSFAIHLPRKQLLLVNKLTEQCFQRLCIVDFSAF